MKNENCKMENKMRNAKCEMRNVYGFSLIELVFAMSFLTIIVFGVVTLQSSTLAMMNRQNNQIQAHFHANQGIQILKAIDYTNIGTGCAPFPATCTKIITTTGSEEYKLDIGSKQSIASTPFTRTIAIDTEDDEGNSLTNAYRIKSIIEWTDSTGAHTLADNSHVEAKIITFLK